MSLSDTRIPYLDAAWNPAAGCTADCPYCFVARYRHRLSCTRCRDPHDLHLHEERLADPARATAPRVVGVCFNSDLFDPKRPPCDVGRVLAAAEAGPQHTYVFSTKQPREAARFTVPPMLGGHDNWWVGVTAEDDEALRARGTVLLGRGIFNLWLSLEPLKGFVFLKRFLGREVPAADEGPLASARTTGFTWVAVGCESGRPFEAAEEIHIRLAIEDVVRQCRVAKVPVYVKQVPVGGRCSRDPAEWPKDLRVQETPWKLRRNA